MERCGPAAGSIRAADENAVSQFRAALQVSDEETGRWEVKPLFGLAQPPPLRVPKLRRQLTWPSDK